MNWFDDQRNAHIIIESIVIKMHQAPKFSYLCRKLLGDDGEEYHKAHEEEETDTKHIVHRFYFCTFDLSQDVGIQFAMILATDKYNALVN